MSPAARQRSLFRWQRVSLKIGLTHVFIFLKLREARFRLHRRRFLRPNTRWNALDEIYKMYMRLLEEKNRI